MALWNNEKQINNQLVAFQTFSLQRSYKKKEEQIWKHEVINLRKMDLIRVQTLLNESIKEVYLRGEQHGHSN